MCSYNSASAKTFIINGVTYTGVSGGTTAVPSSININTGGCCGGETSDWGMAMLITYDGHLTVGDMTKVDKWMMVSNLGEAGKVTGDGLIPCTGLTKSPYYIGGKMRTCFSVDNYNTISGRWPSAGGIQEAGAVFSGSITVEKHLAGRNGVGNKHLRYISGPTTATFNSGPCLKSQYTVCSATRYTGGTKGRILNGGSGNWLHGHWASRAGIAHYNSWHGQHNGRVSPNTNWVYMCAYNSAGRKSMHINGKTYTNIAGGRTSVPAYIGINVGGCCGGEKSQFALAFLATFDGHLTNTEMNIVSKYMMQR